MTDHDPDGRPGHGSDRPSGGAGWIVLAVAGFLLVGTSQAYTVPYTGLGLAPAQLLLLVLAAVWVLTRLLGQRFPAGLGVLTALVVVRECFLLISYGLASGRDLTAGQQAASDQTMVVEAVSAVVVVVVATLLRTRRDVERVFAALVAGGALSGTAAVVQYATGVDVGARLHLPGLRETVAPMGFDLVREGVVRAAGAAAQPLELSAVLTVLLPIAAGGYFAARRRTAPSWPWALAAALMAGGAVTSLSRSAFVGLVVAGVVMALRWPLRRTAGLLAAGLLIGLAALASGSQLIEATHTVLTEGSDDFSLGSRQVGRDYVLAHVTDHFWWGQGPGTYDLSSQPVLDNQYLSLLIEVGSLGLVLWVLLLGCALGYALRATSRGVSADVRELAIGVAGSIAAVMVIELVLDTGGFVQIATLTWLDVGLAAAVWRVGVGPGRDADATVPSEPLRAGVAGAR